MGRAPSWTAGEVAGFVLGVALLVAAVGLVFPGLIAETGGAGWLVAAGSPSSSASGR